MGVRIMNLLIAKKEKVVMVMADYQPDAIPFHIRKATQLMNKLL